MFTYPYKQPDEYHFSLDSIHFAEFVADHLRDHSDLASLQVLDLCAGCGVIGLELSWYRPELRHIHFIEIQEIYASYFQQNIALLNRPELNLNWHLLNYDCLLESTWKKKFDLIVSNPPYFQPEHGMLSPSSFKNRCRFFLDSTFPIFILAMANALTDGGQAFFLLRSLKQHGKDMFEEVRKILAETNVSAKKLVQLRGTDVIQLNKPICCI